MHVSLPPGVYAILPQSNKPHTFDTSLALQDIASSAVVNVAHTSGIPTVKTMLWIITGDGCIMNLGTRRHIANYERDTKVVLSDEDPTKFLINVSANSATAIESVHANAAWIGTVRSATPELAYLHFTSDQKVNFTKVKGVYHTWAFVPASV